MAIEFRYDGKSIDLDDVPLDVYVKIENETKVPWYQLAGAPALHAAAGQMLARECSALIGVELPAKLTPRIILDVFDKTEEPDNRPDEFDEGIPVPKAEASEPATT